nr:hypothetical protein [Desulfobacula sp.]
MIQMIKDQKALLNISFQRKKKNEAVKTGENQILIPILAESEKALNRSGVRPDSGGGGGGS